MPKNRDFVIFDRTFVQIQLFIEDLWTEISSDFESEDEIIGEEMV